ncbi:transposase [Luteimonas endophytica]|uniref:transposase n=1 Tax=Luteimonas endophytica TaxID=3042023 RepID=UPI003CE528CA
MSKRKRYSPEYKHELVELVRRSKSSCRKVAPEVGVPPALPTHWVREAHVGGKQGLSRRWNYSRRGARPHQA